MNLCARNVGPATSFPAVRRLKAGGSQDWLPGVLLALAAVSAALAQPGQLLGPAQQSRMQDSNLKPALPGALLGVGIDQRLDQQISLGVMFKDEAGRDVPVSPFFKRGKPVILAPVYYRCPMLCRRIL